jgi:hypothetical protein
MHGDSEILISTPARSRFSPWFTDRIEKYTFACSQDEEEDRLPPRRTGQTRVAMRPWPLPRVHHAVLARSLPGFSGGCRRCRRRREPTQPNTTATPLVFLPVQPVSTSASSPSILVGSRGSLTAGAGFKPPTKRRRKLACANRNRAVPPLPPCPCPPPRPASI